MALDQSKLAYVDNPLNEYEIELKDQNGNTVTVPKWAKCYCCARHTPKYIHVLPYELPDGTVMYFCPGTHHMLTVLVGIYRDCNWDEKAIPHKIRRKFTVPVRRLALIIKAIELYGIPPERYLRLRAIEKLHQAGDL